jgi:outer membrane protein OmpA-like peptidoglycan-associated protein
MRKSYLLFLSLLALCLLTTIVQAQNYPGYRTSNYSGVNGVFFNPANIALFAIDGYIGNNQTTMGFKDITHSLSADSLKSKFLRSNSPNLRTMSYVDILGASIMYSVTPNTSLALSTRTRVFGNARDINGRVAGAIIDAGTANDNYPFDYNTPESSIHIAGWTEVGLSFAQVLTPKKSHHFFKAGITVKYLGGIADAYIDQNNFAGTVGNGTNGTYLTNTTGNIALNTATNFQDYRKDDFFKFNGQGFGGDIGVVYEYRPVVDFPNYVDDNFLNKYKLKISAAVVDIGKIKFDKNTNSSGSYAVNIPNGQQFLLNQFSGKSLSEMNTILQNSPYFTNTGSNNNSYTVSLPTTLQANIDYQVAGGFYINLGGQFAFTKTNQYHFNAFNSYTLTPRYETRHFGVEIPVNYNDLSNFNAGLSFRAGPLFAGSGSLFTALFNNSKQADVFVGIHIGMQRKKVKADTDKDGITNDKDKCPTVPGLARYDGCPIPDTDGDGVNDEEDSCKTVKGFLRYHGCPIPDTDGDGVNDEEDSCINTPGLPQFHGCPDTDGDGIPDKDDKCPTVAGVAKYFGCPVPDRDKDGIPDDEDLCPDDPGPASSKGCPVEKIVLQITADFKNILFDFGKSTIRPESMEILVNAAKTMNQQIPNSSFYVDGYTDNVGSVARNKKLSKARAQAVADALVASGIDRSRVEARGFGKDNPKCDNKTAEGRQCNRRVEVVIKNINQTQEQKVIKTKP